MNVPSSKKSERTMNFQSNEFKKGGKFEFILFKTVRLFFCNHGTFDNAPLKGLFLVIKYEFAKSKDLNF